jgi:iron complex transport system ATP-binding protein
MSSEPLLQVEGLRFSYNGEGRQALDGLDLLLQAGQVAAVLGPNGAGKTTLLHTLLGILKPQEGRILIDGTPQDEYDRQELSRILGLVPQFEYVAFDFSVEEYVLMGRAPHLGMLQLPTEADYQAAFEAMFSLGILPFRQRSILELSGGERQLVVMARALAQEVRLLLLDEPLAHLDLSNKGRILRLIRQLAARGTAVLFTTHEPELIHRVADHVVLMREGAVIEAGGVDTVMTSDTLTKTYGVEVRVLKIDGELAVRLQEVQ